MGVQIAAYRPTTEIKFPDEKLPLSSIVSCLKPMILIIKIFRKAYPPKMARPLTLDFG
jgi:hypothetical protein